MEVSSKNQRRSERQQTFYPAYAYVLKNAEWARLDVKVFDQSGQGVRLRSMQNLEGEKLYLQLDPTNPVLALCSIRRTQPVARNCWEFGVELAELAEMRDILPPEILSAYGADNVAASSRQINDANQQRTPELAPPAPSTTAELDDLLNNTLGLSELRSSEPEPEPETKPADEIEPAQTPAAGTTVITAATTTVAVATPEPATATPSQAVEETIDTPPIATPTPAVVAEQPAAPTTPVVEELPPVAETVEEPPPIAAPAPVAVAAPPAAPQAETTPVVPVVVASVVAPAASTVEPEPIQPVAAPEAVTPVTAAVPVPAPDTQPVLAAQVEPVQAPEHAPMPLEPNAVPNLQPPLARPKKGFIETVLIGFSGLAGVLSAFVLKLAGVLRVVIGSSVPAGSFFSNKSEDQHRVEWLQAASAGIVAQAQPQPKPSTATSATPEHTGR